VALKGSFCVGPLPTPGAVVRCPRYRSCRHYRAAPAAGATRCTPAAPGCHVRDGVRRSPGSGPTKPTKPTKASKVWSVTKSLYTNELRQRPTNRPKSAETSPNSAQYVQFLQPLVGWSVQRAKPLGSNELVNRPKTSGLVGLVGSWSVRPPSLVTTFSLGCNELRTEQPLR
jgi:hypothetical protein